MRFHDVVSLASDRAEALDELCAGLDEPPDLAMLFLTPHHAPDASEIAAEVRQRTGARHVLAVTAESLIGAGQEIERRSAVALWAAWWPGVEMETFALEAEQTREGFAFIGLPERIGQNPERARGVILLGDPFTFPADIWLGNAAEDFPGVPVVGGMASGGSSAGQNILVRDDEVRRDGAVGVVLSGPVRMRTVVSQGCRPVGRSYVVTRSEQNVLHELGGKPAMDRLRETFAALPDADKDLLARAPHLGCVIDEQKETFGRGDFLIRNLLWADPNRGSLAVAELLRPGQTIQFHVRDAEAADEDLAHLLAEEKKSGTEGGLLFSCNGRGRNLFGTPDHDIHAVRDALGDLPVAGFFAAGEIGPVGGRSFLHGFTASLALFGPA